MKKLFALVMFGFVLSCFPVQAQDTTQAVLATVTSIDMEANSFKVVAKDNKKYTFNVNMQTDFNIENQNNEYDRLYSFNDMRVGDWVRVMYSAMGKKLLVSTVNIYR